MIEIEKENTKVSVVPPGEHPIVCISPDVGISQFSATVVESSQFASIAPVPSQRLSFIAFHLMRDMFIFCWSDESVGVVAIVSIVTVRLLSMVQVLWLRGISLQIVVQLEIVALLLNYVGHNLCLAVPSYIFVLVFIVRIILMSTNLGSSIMGHWIITMRFRTRARYMGGWSFPQKLLSLFLVLLVNCLDFTV